MGKDTVQGDTTQSFDAIWAAALTVGKIRGEIIREDYSQGFIEFKAGSNYAWIRIIRLTRETNRLKISVRKYHLPSQGLAQELFIKILEEAR